MNEFTPFAQQAQENLRSTDNVSWYLIPLLALLFYIYANEIQKKNWNAVLAGLAFWGMDWINEIINSIIFHFNEFAPLWGTPGHSAYTILIGLNVEIMFMFAISGIVWTKLLPENKNLKILGLNNRKFMILAGSIFCVFVEVILNRVDMLTWDHSFWNAKVPWLIIIFGYMTFFVVSFWVYDMKSMKKKIITVGTIFSIVILSLIIFGSLGWI